MGTRRPAPISLEGNTESSALSYAVFELISVFKKRISNLNTSNGLRLLEVFSADFYPVLL